MAEDGSSQYKDSENSGEPMENDVMENGEDDDMNFSDPEDFEEDITDEDLLGDMLSTEPKETDGIDSIIVVDGIPQIGTDRLEKLQSIIRKIFSKFGKILREDYPMEDDKTKGYAFLEYSSPANAQEAVKMTYGHKLDKQHTFLVNLLSDFEKYLSIPVEWEPPEPQPYKDPGNLYYWLLDADCYDQYSVIHGIKYTSIWQNSLPEPTVIEEREVWTETYVRWSPLGTYLATFHARGIALWGGDTFSQIMKFSHLQVQLIDFSPCENYLVTFSPPVDSKEEPKNLIIFDIRTGIKKRGFHCEILPVWPIFRWSCDDKYFARLATDGTLSIYETPSFGLHEKKSLKISGLRDFSWSPTDNIIAYWVAEDKDVPARVTLLEIPSRNELRAKNLFNVADCKMHWQKSGDYLCVKVDRYSKIKKEKNEIKYSGMYYNFEIFHMREKQIPVDSVEIKENITAFAWEPVGSKCCIVHGDSPSICISFYAVKTGGTVSLLKKFEKKQCNHLFWSPHGQFIVLAGLRSMNGVLEFIDTGDMTIMAQTEHFMATDVEWDPTGRYVITGVSWWGHKVDNGYWLWSFQGKLLQRRPLEKFCQLLWRPRPPSLLTQDQIKEVRKNLKKYAGQFETKDKMSLSKASKELIEKRRRLLKEFEEYRIKKMEEFAEEKDARLELRSGVDTDELDSYTENMDEETVEFFIKEEITVLDEE